MSKTEPILDGIFIDTEEGTRLQGNSCGECGQTFFPRVNVCLACCEKNMKDVALSNRGQLFSYTVVRMPSIHFSPPYAVGYVDLPDGVRVFTPLSMDEGDSFTIGSQMELRTQPLWQEDDTDMIGFMAYRV